MTPAWAQRQEALLRDCIVSPAIFNHMVEHLRDFAVPYQHALATEAGQRTMSLYLAGLLSHLDRKNAEEIAALVDGERQVLQTPIGTAPWDHRPLIIVLVGHVVERLGEPKGVLYKSCWLVPTCLVTHCISMSFIRRNAGGVFPVYHDPAGSPPARGGARSGQAPLLLGGASPCGWAGHNQPRLLNSSKVVATIATNEPTPSTR